MSIVLVTGGSGFVASHLILRLLTDGHTVRATLRSLSKEQHVRSALQKSGAINLDRLSFHAADLTEDKGWAEAIQGCSFVHHVASPFPGHAVKDENELIGPAREGTMRVLRAARDAHVKRVIFTSSFAAIGYGYKDRQEPFTEADWSVLEGLPPYHKSKALAEKAAWEFIEAEGGNLELCVINPVGIFGPFNIVDVRDLADLHIRCMLDPAAKNERFIASCDGKPLALIDVARIISQGRPDKAKRVPTAELPTWVVKLAAIFSPAARDMVPLLDIIRPINNDKAKTVLGWVPRTARDTILDTVDSLMEHGIA